MPLTRDFKETIRARVERDPKFRKELLREGIARYLEASFTDSQSDTDQAPPLDAQKPAGVLVPFARHGRSKPQSFPRKRESDPQTFGNALSRDWIPAFAGMTGIS